MVLDNSNVKSADIDNIPIEKAWNVGDEKCNLMHGIHAYPAKFPPFITTKALRYAQERGINVETIADVFCGCGTVAYEALANGKNFFGCDINPVASLIARTKCRRYERLLLVSYLEKIRRLFFEIKILDQNEFSENERIRYWFCEKQLSDLYKLRQSITSEVENKFYRDFFLCAYSAILKSCSRWLTKSIKPQIDPNKKPKNVWSSFVAQVEIMVKANASSNILKNCYAEIHTGSILEMTVKEPFVNLVVTSPPYVTSYEYADLHQLSTLCLGYSADYRHYRKGTIGTLYNQDKFEENLSKINDIGFSIVMELYAVDKRRAKSVSQYYIDMQAVVRKIYEMLQNGGICVFVIGNTEYKGVRIDNARHIAKSLLDENFQKVEITRRKISNKILTPYRDKSGKFSSDKNSRKIYSEEFLIFAQK